MSLPIPVVIEFAPGSRILRVENRFEIENGDQKTSIPTEQVVLEEESQGAATVGLGGMSFEGMKGELLVFWRVRDLWPEDRLDPAADERMTLEPKLVSRVLVQGNQVWPREKSLV